MKRKKKIHPYDFPIYNSAKQKELKTMVEKIIDRYGSFSKRHAENITYDLFIKSISQYRWRMKKNEIDEEEKIHLKKIIADLAKKK